MCGFLLQNDPMWGRCVHLVAMQQILGKAAKLHEW